MAGAALRLYQIDNKTVWLDEAFNIWLVRHSVPDMIRLSMDVDRHPPLYYLLFHYWIQLGGQVQVWALDQGQVTVSEKPAFPAEPSLNYTFPPYSITLLIVPAQRWSWLWFGGGMACALFLGAGIWFSQRRRRV